jgi:UDP-glucose 4-epimerase
MKILITGNAGYIGPEVARRLRKAIRDVHLIGYDSGFFAHCLTNAPMLPERLYDEQYFGDVREMPESVLSDVDAVIHLAAISNDPMGKQFEQVTEDVNFLASVAVAKLALKAGVKNFVYASSCSVYGVADGPPRKETDSLNPITAYAKSKINTEVSLRELDTDMVITCMRFATACGMSDRLRLDLVLNDFVACAVGIGEITVLSDGSPWRPLIDIRDMARAMEWGATRSSGNGGQFLSVNVGSAERNYQVRDIANAVAAAFPSASININTSAPADSRSYKVDFSLFADLAPDHQPQVTLTQSVAMLKAGLEEMGFADPDFRNSPMIRLRVLEGHMNSGRLTPSLRWTDAKV